MMKIRFLFLMAHFLGLDGSRVGLDSQCLNCFNIDYDRTIWLEQEQQGKEISGSRNPETPTDLFGFSLALGESKVYIGAPGFGDTGNVFHCPVSFDRSINSGKSRKVSCSDTKLNDQFKQKGKSATKSNIHFIV